MMHRSGIVSMIALTSFLCCGMTAPTSCKGGGGGGNGAIIGGAVAVVAVVAVAVTAPVVLSHSKHNIQGCVFEGANGLELQDGPPDGFKNYALAGNTPDIKVGDRVKLHGVKLKHGKGDSGAQVFTVDVIRKDYGLCKVPPVVPGDTRPLPHTQP